MLTCQWQTLSPDLGAGVPEEVDAAGQGDAYRRALEISRDEYDRRRRISGPRRTPCAWATASATCSSSTPGRRYGLVELRSGREGHPTYRAVAHEMHAQIAAVHPAVSPRR